MGILRGATRVSLHLFLVHIKVNCQTPSALKQLSPAEPSPLGGIINAIGFNIDPRLTSYEVLIISPYSSARRR